MNKKNINIMPLNQLILIFILLPIIEITVLFEIHQSVGFFLTILLVFSTGIIGAILVRRQGLSILFRIRQELASGHIPTKAMIDGIMVLIAGAFLVTPGLITDVVGFALLIPYTRNIIRKWIRYKLEKHVNNGYINTQSHNYD